MGDSHTHTSCAMPLRTDALYVEAAWPAANCAARDRIGLRWSSRAMEH